MLVDWGADLLRCVDHELDGMEIHEGTLSQALATVFRTESQAGKAAWTAALAFGTVLLWDHIARFQYSHKAGAR